MARFYRKRACFESGQRLSVSDVLEVWDRVAKGTPFPEDDRSFQIRLPTSQLVTVTADRRHFGGYQRYFRCPRTGRRARVLYRPYGASYFASQRHWKGRAAYASQFLDAVGRAHAKIQRCEARLDWNEDNQAYYRPRYMHWRTFDAICAKMDAADNALNRHLQNKLPRLLNKLHAT
jgi:hypothetical protein